MQISLTDASVELVSLVEAALQGEEIIILKGNQRSRALYAYGISTLSIN